MSKLLSPEDVLVKLSRHYKDQWRVWALADGGHSAAHLSTPDWPRTLPLGRPTRNQLDNELELVGDWADTWKLDRVPDGLEVEWVQRPSRNGPQRIPLLAIVNSAQTLAGILRKENHWSRAVSHSHLLAKYVPEVEPRTALQDLSLLNDHDVELAVLAAQSIRANPNSGLYPRQLAIPGLDSKWVETHRGVLRALTSDVAKPDLGLRKVPTTADMLLADPGARARRGLPRFFAVSRDELSGFDHGVPADEVVVLVVENRQCAIDLPDIPGLVVLHGLGNSAPELLAYTAWVREASQVIYWGDMDLAGYSILHRVRELGIAAESMLMDITTFGSMLQHATAGKEQAPGPTNLLTQTEAEVVSGILGGRWGDARQIEQEKIPTSVAVAALVNACAGRVGVI